MWHPDRNEYGNVVLGQRPKPDEVQKQKNISRRTEKTAKNQRLDSATTPEKLKFFDPEFIKKVIKARNTEKLSQQQLNEKFNFPKGTIQQFEQNKLQYSGQIKNKLTIFVNKVENNQE